MDEQISYWEKLKAEIISVREKGYEATDVIAMSETYFKLADETVLIIIKQTIDDIRIKIKFWRKKHMWIYRQDSLIRVNAKKCLITTSI